MGKAVATHGEATRHYRGLAEAQQAAAGIGTRLAEISVSIAVVKIQDAKWNMKPEHSAQNAALQKQAEQAHADANDRHRRLKDAIESASASLGRSGRDRMEGIRGSAGRDQTLGVVPRCFEAGP